MWDIVCPFSNEEMARSLRAMKDGAPGPDQVTKERLLLLPVAQLTCRFNIWLLLGVAPDSFRNGVTVLIPKSGDAVEPAQFRPITIGPILCRLFHRILAQRIEASYSISERQKAFRKGDGIADNTYILRFPVSQYGWPESAVPTGQCRLPRRGEGVWLRIAWVSIPCI